MYTLSSVCKALEKQRNKKIVLHGGSFDLIHVGHIRLLAKAKAAGDILVVGLNSDDLIRRIKIPRRPIIPEKQRAEVLLGLKSVDYVFISDRKVHNNKHLTKLKPDILVFSKEKKKLARHKKAALDIAKKFPEIKTIFLSAGTADKISTSTIEASIVEKFMTEVEDARRKEIRTRKKTR